MSTRKLRRKYRPSSHSNNISGKSRIVRRNLNRRREIDAQKKWYVIRANIGCERRAELSLRAIGVDIFRPIDDRWRVYKHRCSDASLGWFGRYLFAGLVPDIGLGGLCAADGVETVLGIAGRPVAVRPEVLQAVADQIAGYRALGPVAGLSLGDKVKIQVGAWADFDGLIEELDGKRERAKVKVGLFGRDNIIELDFLDLKAA